jgi:hypothetical protein
MNKINLVESKLRKIIHSIQMSQLTIQIIIICSNQDNRLSTIVFQEVEALIIHNYMVKLLIIKCIKDHQQILFNLSNKLIMLIIMYLLLHLVMATKIYHPIIIHKAQYKKSLIVLSWINSQYTNKNHNITLNKDNNPHNNHTKIFQMISINSQSKK